METMAELVLLGCFFFSSFILSQGNEIHHSSYTKTKVYCSQGDACWPTSDEIADFYEALDPRADRYISWTSESSPRTCSVPFGSKYDQPFYGAYNETIEPVYYNGTTVDGGRCLLEPWINPIDHMESRQVCLSSIRNNPLNLWEPAFVAWPLTAEHVSTAVKFAVDHDLCIMVAGTGHDFLNRHSCNNGLLIRTILLKSISWDMEYNNGEGCVTLGSGHTFSEIAKTASENNRLISQGWAVSVGVAGWSFGGGHGPFANYAGLGIDNIISAKVVSATGDVLFVNATNEYADLWWALRGGGGSTWGVVVELTLQAHYLPEGGITEYFVEWFGTGCSSSVDKRTNILKAYLEWSLTLDEKWSGLTFVTPKVSSVPNQCGSNWTLFIEFNFLGDHEVEGDTVWNAFINSIDEVHKPVINVNTTFDSQWSRAEPYSLEVIYPYPWLPPSNQSVGGIGSVLVSRDVVEGGDFLALMNERLLDCDVKYGDTAVCSSQQIYQDITGNLNAPQAPNISTNPNFRNALYHFVIPVYNHSKMETVYQLGPNSYFSEEAYEIGDVEDPSNTPYAGTWQSRNFGSNFDALLEIKNKYDPNGVFWCRHCVGDEN